MDVRNWCNSGTGTIQLGEYYDELDRSMSTTSRSSNKPVLWKLLWRKLKKEKSKMIVSPGHVQVSYDAYTYSQNFDQGSMWDEPDNLSRSFSVRFSDPSKISVNQGIV